MGLDITDDVIRSSTSEHTARPVRGGGWEVSWLPGRVLDKARATSGMLLADTVGAGLSVGDDRWPALDTWARELGMSGPEAVVRASTTDEVREHVARAEAAAGTSPVTIAATSRRSRVKAEAKVQEPSAGARVAEEAASTLARLQRRLEPGSETRISGAVEAHRTRQKAERALDAETDPDTRKVLTKRIVEARETAEDLVQAALHDGVDREVIDFALMMHGSRAHGGDAIGSSPAEALLPALRDAAEGTRSDALAEEALDADVDHYLDQLAGADRDTADADLLPHADVDDHRDPGTWPAREASLGARIAAMQAAVPMTGPVEESEAGEAWSRRVDAAVHGFDATRPGDMDAWMRTHATSDIPQAHEAELVAAWESRAAAEPSGVTADRQLDEHARTGTTEDAVGTDDIAVRD